MFCAYTRPRYQVSVYRTIDTLVFLFLLHNIDCGYSLEILYKVVLSKNKKKITIFANTYVQGKYY